MAQVAQAPRHPAVPVGAGQAPPSRRAGEDGNDYPDWRKMKNEIEKTKSNLKELSEAMAATAQSLAVLDGQLVPYWYAKGDIEDDIRCTHQRGSRGEMVFDPSGAGARVPLFVALDELTREWGPVKTDRAAVKSRLSGYERDYKRLMNELKYLEKKEARNDKGQGSLL